MIRTGGGRAIRSPTWDRPYEPVDFLRRPLVRREGIFSRNRRAAALATATRVGCLSLIALAIVSGCRDTGPRRQEPTARKLRSGGERPRIAVSVDGIAAMAETLDFSRVDQSWWVPEPVSDRPRVRLLSKPDMNWTIASVSIFREAGVPKGGLHDCAPGPDEHAHRMIASLEAAIRESRDARRRFEALAAWVRGHDEPMGGAASWVMWKLVHGLEADEQSRRMALGLSDPLTKLINDWPGSVEVEALCRHYVATLRWHYEGARLPGQLLQNLRESIATGDAKLGSAAREILELIGCYEELHRRATLTAVDIANLLRRWGPVVASAYGSVPVAVLKLNVSARLGAVLGCRQKGHEAPSNEEAQPELRALEPGTKYKTVLLLEKVRTPVTVEFRTRAGPLRTP